MKTRKNVKQALKDSIIFKNKFYQMTETWERTKTKLKHKATITVFDRGTYRFQLWEVLKVGSIQVSHIGNEAVL